MWTRKNRICRLNSKGREKIRQILHCQCNNDLTSKPPAFLLAVYRRFCILKSEQLDIGCFCLK